MAGVMLWVGDLLVPRLWVSGREDDLGVWIGGYQLWCKCGSRQVAHSLAVAEELVPILFVELALTIPLCLDGLHPQLAVAGCFGAGCPHVICFKVPQ